MSDAAQILLDLKDIHEPAAPAASSAFFLGFFILFGVALFVGAVGYFLWRRNALNRSLQRELEQISTSNDDHALFQLAVLLRRVMHHIHGDSINHLQNEQWLDSLNKTFTTQYFSKGRGAIFGDALYQSQNKRPPTLQISTDSATQSTSHPGVQELCSDLQRLIARVRLKPHTRQLQ